ncbi:Uncharacterised protein [Pluralibacter gergoviae]|nr:Uncharacterised protein [Pluralibacter gergoviae]
MNYLRGHGCGQIAEADEIVDAARRADGGGMDNFRIELNEQVIGEKRLADGGSLSADDFFQGDSRRKTVNILALKVFHGPLKLTAFAVK